MPVPILHRLAYFARFGVSLLARRPLPAIVGLSLTDVCNLDCLHCWRKNAGRGHLSFERVESVLKRHHARGGRYLYIQGGEPFLWTDGTRRLQNVIEAARLAGYFHIVVCTNGTLPLDAEPDSFSVSVEGLARSHDAIRCGTFDKVRNNIRQSRHPRIFLNMTLNTINAGEFRDFVREASRWEGVTGILVNFHIPYPGVENLSLGMDERRALALQALSLKMAGWPILNTPSGLRALAQNNWRRPLSLSVVTDGEREYSCCRARGQEDVCRHCGYGVWAEASRVLALDVPAMVESLLQLHKRPSGRAA